MASSSGRGASRSNDCSEVFGYPGLFVVDGSTLSTGLAVNLSLNIAAVAERAATWTIYGHELIAGSGVAVAPV